MILMVIASYIRVSCSSADDKLKLETRPSKGSRNQPACRLQRYSPFGKLFLFDHDNSALFMDMR